MRLSTIYIKKIVPQCIISFARLCKSYLVGMYEYLYDLNRFLNHSTAIKNNYNQLHYEYKFLMHSHTIEKGLSFIDIKTGFGVDKVDRLINLLEEYKRKGFDCNNEIFQQTLLKIYEYISFNKSRGVDLNDIESRVNNLYPKPHINITSVYSIRKSDIYDSLGQDYFKFSKMRFSIRNFEPSPIDKNKLYQAIGLSLKSPTSCNRQPMHIYYACSDIVQDILSIQTGNEGFGHLIKNLLIVTIDNCAYHGLHERNCLYIDGGFYAMNLVYSLHYYGLGTCILNWKVNKENDIQLRKIIKNLKNFHTVICLVAVGNMPDKIKVCRAHRKSIGSILTEVQ
jgi:hypothetical protein